MMFYGVGFVICTLNSMFYLLQHDLGWTVFWMVCSFFNAGAYLVIKEEL